VSGQITLANPALLRRRFPHIPRRRLPHPHQFFRRGRMQREGGVEIGFSRFHLHGDGDGLDDFGGGVTDDVAAEHAVGRAVDHQLQKGCGYRGRTWSP
jgi:hypothetical protein